MTKTKNCQLNQWEASDPIRREDFNADNQKIDAALGELADQVYFGSWIGDGTKNRIIQLPFAPRLLIVFGNYYDTSASNTRALLILATQNCAYAMSNSGCLYSSLPTGGILVDDEFQMGGYPVYNNYSDQTVYYMALR